MQKVLKKFFLIAPNATTPKQSSSTYFNIISDILELVCDPLCIFLSHLVNIIIVATLLELIINVWIVKVKVKVKSLSRVGLFATPWTVAYQAPPSMGFSRQECWSGLPFLSPGDLPDPGIEPGSDALQADALPSEPPGKP